jgi:hypothetical protein
VAAVILIASPAFAWDAGVDIGQLDSAFYADSWSGTLDWVTVQEGVQADSGFGSIPINYTFQSWDGNAWPSDTMHDDENTGGVFAESDIFHNDATDEFLNSASGYVFGDINPG